MSVAMHIPPPSAAAGTSLREELDAVAAERDGTGRSAEAASAPGAAAVDISPRSGRLRELQVTSQECSWTAFMHVAALMSLFIPFMFVVPFFIWLAMRKESAFVDDHGRELLNFVLSMLIFGAIAALLGLWFIVWVVAIVNLIRAAVAASRGEYFRYPITLRFLS